MEDLNVAVQVAPKRELIDLPKFNEVVEYISTKHEKGKEYADQLLLKIKTVGMTPDLVEASQFMLQTCKDYNKEFKSMRSPFTSKFDDLRKAFTQRENDFDPSKKDSIAYKFQEILNEHARTQLKLANDEAVAKQKELDKANEVEDLKASALLQLWSIFDDHIKVEKAAIFALFTEKLIDSLNEYKPNLDNMLYLSWIPMVNVVSRYGNDVLAIRTEALRNTYQECYDRLTLIMYEYKNELLEKVKSVDEVGSVEVIAKMENEIQESNIKDVQDKIEVQTVASKLTNNMDAISEEVIEKPKVKRSLKIEVVEKTGYYIISKHWFDLNLAALSPEKIGRKTINSMIKDMEKVANAGGDMIDSPTINYVEDIKAL